VPERPYTLLSCSMSLDGFIDGADESRLLLSNDEDLARVDRVRAGVDAILVGATTIRNDNPRLLVRDPGRRRARLDRGLTEHPVKVTVTQVTLPPYSQVAPIFFSGTHSVMVPPAFP